MPTISREYAASREAKALGCSPARAIAPPIWRTSTRICGDAEPGPVSASRRVHGLAGEVGEHAPASKAGVGSSGSVCTESIAV